MEDFDTEINPALIGSRDPISQAISTLFGGAVASLVDAGASIWNTLPWSSTTVCLAVAKAWQKTDSNKKTASSRRMTDGSADENLSQSYRLFCRICCS